LFVILTPIASVLQKGRLFFPIVLHKFSIHRTGKVDVLFRISNLYFLVFSWHFYLGL